MGLDNFSSESSTDSKDDTQDNQESEDNSKVQQTIEEPIDEEDMKFYGAGETRPDTTPMERKGAMSNHTVSELSKTADGDIEFERDLVKLHLPLFTTITKEKKYSQGERYNLVSTQEQPKPSWDGKVVACIAVSETRFGNINKEVAMFNAGSHSKRRVMKRFKSKLSKDIGADDTVFIATFGDVFFLRDLAQVSDDPEFKEGGLLNRDKIARKMLMSNQLRVHNKEKDDTN